MATIFDIFHARLSAPILETYFGDDEWSRAADVETTEQAGDPVVYATVSGCIWHPDVPDLKTDESRRRELIAGSLLVPTALDLVFSVKDRWKDAENVVWRPQTISDDINGFRHVLLTRESRQFSGQTGKRGGRG